MIRRMYLVRDPGGRGEPCDLQVEVQDSAKRRVPLGGLVALGLLQQPAQRLKGGRVVSAGLAQAPPLAGDRVGPGIDDDPERAAGQLLYVTLRLLAMQ